MARTSSNCTGDASEQWRPVVGYEGYYQVSSLGRVRSLVRMKPLIGSIDSCNYHRVTLWTPRGQATKKVHRLVCEAFHGPPNLLHREAAHLDGNGRNNCAANLKWVSHAENISHKPLHGTDQVGEKHPRAKLDDRAVEEIVALLAGNSTCREIADRYGVSASAIEDIRSGNRWRHIPRPQGFFAPRSTGNGQGGARNHWAKLDDSQVAEIRRRAASGESVPRLGREFGVSRATAYKVVARQTYRETGLAR